MHIYLRQTANVLYLFCFRVLRQWKSVEETIDTSSFHSLHLRSNNLPEEASERWKAKPK